MEIFKEMPWNVRFVFASLLFIIVVLVVEGVRRLRSARGKS